MDVNVSLQNSKSFDKNVCFSLGQGLKWEKKCRHGTLSLSISLLPLSLFQPLLLPYLPSAPLRVPFLSRKAPPQIQLEGLRSTANSTQRVRAKLGRQTVSGAFCDEITIPVIALLKRFSDNQVCIVTVVAQRRTGIVLKLAVWFPAGQGSAGMAHIPIPSSPGWGTYNTKYYYIYETIRTRDNVDVGTAPEEVPRSPVERLSDQAYCTVITRLHIRRQSHHVR